MLQVDLTSAVRTDAPYWTVLPGLLEQRSMSLRGLHERSGVPLAVLWRGLNPQDKAPRKPGAKMTFQLLKAEHLRRIADVLDLGEGYFAEVREAAVKERIEQDARLRDALFDALRPLPDPSRPQQPVDSAPSSRQEQPAGTVA